MLPALLLCFCASAWASPSFSLEEAQGKDSPTGSLSQEWESLKLNVSLLWTDYLMLSEELEKSRDQSGLLMKQVEDLEAESRRYRTESAESTVLLENYSKEIAELRREKKKLISVAVITGVIGFASGVTVMAILSVRRSQ